MAETPTFVNRRWRLAQGALRRWILFFVIVWSIAGAFVLLDSALLQISKIVSNAGLALWNSVPSGISVAAANPVDHCKDVLAQWGRTQSTRDLHPDVGTYSREFAWRMGFEVGRVAGPLSMGRSTVADTQKFLEKARQMATFLQAPAPTLPKVKRTMNSFGEFREYIENDPQCIAAYLAQTFSPQHAQLYKFGEALGFSTFYRIVFPEGGTLLGPQIRRYGKLAELPESMWIGLARETKVPVPGSDANAKLNGVTKPFHEYFSCQRENRKSCSVMHGGK